MNLRFPYNLMEIIECMLIQKNNKRNFEDAFEQDENLET